MRVDKFKNLLPMKILNEDDVRTDRLSDYIIQMLDQKRIITALPIDTNGAANSADFLSRWVKKGLIDYD
jgi:hypothetical protein